MHLVGIYTKTITMHGHLNIKYFRHVVGCLGGLISPSSGLYPYTENNSNTQTTIQTEFKDFIRLIRHGKVLTLFTLD